jgi:hypothetical protein
MEFIFCKLPIDIKKYILLYDEHFIVRNGEIVSIIPKTDCRYKLLNYITFTPNYISKENNKYMYRYFFQKLYNFNAGQIKNDEIIQIHLTENEDNIEYLFWIGRQYPKSIYCEFGKKQIYNIENQLEYNWTYTNFEFIRFNYIRK